MKKLPIIILFVVLLSSIAFAVDFIPQGNILGRNTYMIANFTNISTSKLCLNGVCQSSWSAGNPFNQSLNKEDNVEFQNISADEVVANFFNGYIDWYYVYNTPEFYTKNETNALFNDSLDVKFNKVTTNTLKATGSGGLTLKSNGDTDVATFGQGGGSQITFYGAGTFNSYLRVGNSGHGDSMFESKASTNDGSTGIIHGYDNNSNEVFALQSNGDIYQYNGTFYTNKINSSSVYIPRGAGVVSYSGITSLGNGNGTINSTVAYCYNTEGISGTLSRVTIPSVNISFTDDWKTNANHIYVDCNTNTFINSYATKYSFTSSNGRYIKYADVIRDGTSLHIEPSVLYADSGERESQKSCDLQEYWITESSSQTLSITLNSTFHVSHSAVDTYACGYFDTQPATTSSERLFNIVRNTTTDWQKTSATNPMLNYTHFDNGTGYQAYTTGYFGRCFYYMGVEVGSHVYTRCVNQYATKELAKADTSIPSVPILITEHTELLGVIVFNSSNATDYEVLFDKNSLTAATPSSDYNSLTNKPDLTIYALNTSLSNYVLTTTFNSVGNWSLDKTSYNTTAQNYNIFYNKSNPNNYINMSNLTSYNTTLELRNIFLNLTDQRYNESLRIDSLNSTKGNASTGTCAAGSFVQNTTTTGVQCAIASASITGGNCPAGQVVQNISTTGVPSCVVDQSGTGGSVNGTSINVTTSYFNNGLIIPNSAEPSAKPDSIVLFSETKAGTSHFAYMKEDGFDSYVQPRMADKQFILCLPLMMATGTTAPTCLPSGTITTAQGTVSNPTPIFTVNTYKSVNKWNTILSIATANLNASPQYYMGVASIFRGTSAINTSPTYISSVFGFHNGATAIANSHINSSGFVGLSPTGVIANTTYPNSMINAIGVYYMPTNNTLWWGSNDGTANSSLKLDCGSDYPSPIAKSNASYQIMFYTNGKNSTVYGELKRKDVGGISACSYAFSPIEADMPLASTALAFRLQCFKHMEAQACAVALQNLYIENNI